MKPQRFHFPCSHMVTACQAHHVDLESKIPTQLSVLSLLNAWSPRFEPFRDEKEWPPYDGPKYVVDPRTKWHKRGSRKRSRYKMQMDRIPGASRRSKANPFVVDPEHSQCRTCNRYGHNSRRCGHQGQVWYYAR